MKMTGSIRPDEDLVQEKVSNSVIELGDQLFSLYSATESSLTSSLLEAATIAVAHNRVHCYGGLLGDFERGLGN